MKKSSKKHRKSTKTSSDAAPSQKPNKDNLEKSVAALNINASPNPDEVDDAPNAIRSAKVWNEPTYNKRQTIPSPLNLPLSPDSETALDDHMTPLHIQVERGSKFFGDPIRMYPMYSCPRGYALIINNQEFDDADMYPYRKGAEVDAENLEKLYTQLGFTVMSYMNMKRNATLKKLIEFSEIAGSKAVDMMVVCMLSHGMENGKIVSADGLLMDTETDVLRRFNNDYCPELKGKPKFFIIQACRGEDQDYGVLSPKGDTTDAVPTRDRKHSFIQKELSWEDMLIAYSTLPGYVSNRDHYRGTWFIESICKVFIEHAKDMNLRDMLDEVGLVLSMYESESGTKQSFNYDVRHFYKKLFFNPGINIEPKDKWKHSNSLDFDSIQAVEMKEQAQPALVSSASKLKKRTISVSAHFENNESKE